MTTDAVIPLSYERASPSPDELQTAQKRLWNNGVDPDRIIFWFIGTFGRTYDLETVIRVARALQERNDRRAQFVLSGDGGSLAECRNLAAGLENVVFTGWVNSTEIEWMMSVASWTWGLRPQRAARPPQQTLRIPGGGFAYSEQSGS